MVNRKESSVGNGKGNGVRIFIANLNYRATDEDVKDFLQLQDIGRIGEVKICTDPATGRSRGFGFADLPGAAGPEAAIAALNGKEFMDRKLVVDRAKDKGR